ncbi:MAG TPA: DEAD/DEAH box helicase [Polyangia bacterium]|jgi:Superfamily II DNA and RNA helicases|nr:DEAD/DEAH box helicase [Polyangia bacterium]
MIDQAEVRDNTDASSPAAAAASDSPVEKKTSFADLGLRPEILHALTDMGFVEPMEVQTVTLPLVRAGRDIMVQSRTGSGKTAAFGIPFADGMVDPDQKSVQAIVLLPTRELALQVAAEIARIAAQSGLSIVPVYGGAPMGRQIEQLRAGGQIVCGTPGRILDHLRRGTLHLDKVKCAVLDECDEMLSMGFQEDIEAILERTPKERQTMLFSATLPEGIQRLARRYMRQPEMVALSADFVGVHEIRHIYYSIPGGQREAELSRVLAFENPDRALIFCNTREETGRVAEFLRRQGLDAEAISSDLSQSERENVMTRMRAGSIRFLVATDVAARGIDIEHLPCVINYTFPDSPESYIHRTGRTGRAGRSGQAISLIGPTEVGSFYYLKLLYKIRPEERALPSEAELRSKHEGESVLRLRSLLPGDVSPEWRSLARRIMGAGDGERLVGCLLRGALAGKEARVEPPKPLPQDSAEPAAKAGDEPARPAREPAESRHGHGDYRDRERSGPSRGRPPRDRERASSDRPRFGGERHERVERSPRPERALRPSQPTTAAGAPSSDGREFWEVWSEEVGRTPAASPAPAPETAEAPGEAPAAASPPPAASYQAATPSYQAPAPGQVRLYLNLGRKDGVSTDEIVALLASTGVSVPATSIDTMNTHTYINVDSADGEKLCAGLVGKERNGRAIMCEPARPPRRR